VIRGKFKSESADMIELQSDDLTIQIPRKDILTILDVDLSKGIRMADPTFGGLKAYVTDPSGGLGKDIVARISDTLKIDEAKVREIWESRFVQTGTYDSGDLKKTPIYTTLHEATFSKGGWLREGMSMADPTAGQPKVPRPRRFAAGSNNQQNQQKLNPDFSDDPEVWWKIQVPETRFCVLKAFAAEKLFRVKEIRTKPCPECGGAGVLRVWGGVTDYAVCPSCRGAKVIFRVIYE
jgi:rubredoxin